MDDKGAVRDMGKCQGKSEKRMGGYTRIFQQTQRSVLR